jgi:hypothetical protein
MEWGDDPPATDVLLQMRIPHGSGSPCRLQIDKLPDGRYRATATSLVEARDVELCRTPDLEQVLRHTYRLDVCRSFREVLTALQRLSELDDDRTGGLARTAGRSPPPRHRSDRGCGRARPTTRRAGLPARRQ